MSAAGYSRGLGAVVGLAVAAVIVTLLLSGQIRSRAERVADALTRAPAARVAEFPADARARVEGQVRLGGAALTAPVSGRRCAHYELVLEGPERSVRQAESRDFSVEDATGTARVVAHGATIAVTRDDHCVRGTLADARSGAHVDTLLKRHGWSGVDPGAVRYRECALVAGARVAVAGASARGGRGGRLLLRATPESPLDVGDLLPE